MRITVHNRAARLFCFKPQINADSLISSALDSPVFEDAKLLSKSFRRSWAAARPANQRLVLPHLENRKWTNLLPPRTVFSDMSMSLDPQTATKTGSPIRLGRSQLCSWKCGSENKWAKTVNRNKDCTYPEITNEVAGHRAILPNRIPITSTCSQNRTHQPVNPTDLEAQGMSLAKLFPTCDMLEILEQMPGAPRSSKDPSTGMMLLILLRPFSIVFKRYGSSMNEGSSNQKCSHSNQSLTAKIRLKAMSSSSCLVQLRSTFDITFKGRRKHLFSWAEVPGQRHFWWDGKGLARFGILE